jgi:uncharacterized protein YebE (UPF0316 family)
MLIFLLRIVDVSLSTTRIITAVRGHRILAATIGFGEVLVWIIGVGNALRHMDSWMHLLGYAAGFSTGTWVGITIASRLAFGLNVVRGISRLAGRPSGAAHPVAERLRAEGYAVTEVSGRGKDQQVDILNVVVPTRNVPHVTAVMQGLDPDIFISVEEVRTIQGGFLPPADRKAFFLRSP